MKAINLSELIEDTKVKEVKTKITQEDINEAGYSTHPATIASRKYYAKLTASKKKKLFKRQESLKKNKWKAGYCYTCHKKREPHRIANRLCQSCQDRSDTRIKDYRVNNALDGKCAKCPNKVQGNSSHCEACKAKAREYMRKKRNVSRPSEKC